MYSYFYCVIYNHQILSAKSKLKMNFPPFIVLKILIVSEVSKQSVYKMCIVDTPDGCRLDEIDMIDMLNAQERVSLSKSPGLKCDTNVGFGRFNVTTWSQANKCSTSTPKAFSCEITLKPSCKSRKQLDVGFDMPKFFDFLRLFNCRFLVRIANVKGIGLELFNDWTDLVPSTTYGSDLIDALEFRNVRFDFYLGKQRVRSCHDLVRANLTQPNILQVAPYDGLDNVLMLNCEFKYAVCPLIFNETIIEHLQIYGLFNSIFKKSFLRFTNDESFEAMYTTVRNLGLFNLYEMSLNLELLNPYVFHKLKFIYIGGDLLAIDPSIFHKLQRYCNLNAT